MYKLSIDNDSQPSGSQGLTPGSGLMVSGTAAARRPSSATGTMSWMEGGGGRARTSHDGIALEGRLSNPGLTAEDSSSLWGGQPRASCPAATARQQSAPVVPGQALAPQASTGSVGRPSRQGAASAARSRAGVSAAAQGLAPQSSSGSVGRPSPQGAARARGSDIAAARPVRGITPGIRVPAAHVPGAPAGTPAGTPVRTPACTPPTSVGTPAGTPPTSAGTPAGTPAGIPAAGTPTGTPVGIPAAGDPASTPATSVQPLGRGVATVAQPRPPAKEQRRVSGSGAPTGGGAPVKEQGRVSSSGTPGSGISVKEQRRVSASGTPSAKSPYTAGAPAVKSPYTAGAAGGPRHNGVASKASGKSSRRPVNRPTGEDAGGVTGKVRPRSQKGPSKRAPPQLLATPRWPPPLAAIQEVSGEYDRTNSSGAAGLPGAALDPVSKQGQPALVRILASPHVAHAAAHAAHAGAWGEQAELAGQGLMGKPPLQPGAGPQDPLSLSGQELDPSLFQLGRKLGSGSFATVYLARWLMATPQSGVLESVAAAAGAGAGPAGVSGAGAVSPGGATGPVGAASNGTAVSGAVSAGAVSAGAGAVSTSGMFSGSVARRCVVKRLDREPADPEEVMNEISCMRRAGVHPNLVHFLGWYRDPDTGLLCLVMSFCEGGTLDMLLKTGRPGEVLGDDPESHFPEELVMCWFVQLLMALNHLHTRQIIHRDLKPENIFLSKNYRVIKLGDLGIAKQLEGTLELAITCLGTPYYMSPEVIAARPYTYASDLWSLGCVLYEMAARRPAFEALGLPQLMFKIMRTAYDCLPTAFSRPFTQLVNCLLRADPDDRPTTQELLQLPFVRKHLQLLLGRGLSVDRIPSHLQASAAIKRLERDSASNTGSRPISSSKSAGKGLRAREVQSSLDSAPPPGQPITSSSPGSHPSRASSGSTRATATSKADATSPGSPSPRGVVSQDGQGQARQGRARAGSKPGSGSKAGAGKRVPLPANPPETVASSLQLVQLVRAGKAGIQEWDSGAAHEAKIARQREQRFKAREFEQRVTREQVRAWRRERDPEHQAKEAEILALQTRMLEERHQHKVSAAQRQLLSEMLGADMAAGGTGVAFECRDRLLRTPQTLEELGQELSAAAFAPRDGSGLGEPEAYEYDAHFEAEFDALSSAAAAALQDGLSAELESASSLPTLPLLTASVQTGQLAPPLALCSSQGGTESDEVLMGSLRLERLLPGRPTATDPPAHPLSLAAPLPSADPLPPSELSAPFCLDSPPSQHIPCLPPPSFVPGLALDDSDVLMHSMHSMSGLPQGAVGASSHLYPAETQVKSGQGQGSPEPGCTVCSSPTHFTTPQPREGSPDQPSAPGALSHQEPKEPSAPRRQVHCEVHSVLLAVGHPEDLFAAGPVALGKTGHFFLPSQGQAIQGSLLQDPSDEQPPSQIPAAASVAQQGALSQEHSQATADQALVTGAAGVAQQAHSPEDPELGADTTKELCEGDMETGEEGGSGAGDDDERGWVVEKGEGSDGDLEEGEGEERDLEDEEGEEWEEEDSEADEEEGEEFESESEGDEGDEFVEDYDSDEGCVEEGTQGGEGRERGGGGRQWSGRKPPAGASPAHNWGGPHMPVGVGGRSMRPVTAPTHRYAPPSGPHMAQQRASVAGGGDAARQRHQALRSSLKDLERQLASEWATADDGARRQTLDRIWQITLGENDEDLPSSPPTPLHASCNSAQAHSILPICTAGVINSEGQAGTETTTENMHSLSKAQLGLQYPADALIARNHWQSNLAYSASLASAHGVRGCAQPYAGPLPLQLPSGAARSGLLAPLPSDLTIPPVRASSVGHEQGATLNGNLRRYSESDSPHGAASEAMMREELTSDINMDFHPSPMVYQGPNGVARGDAVLLQTLPGSPSWGVASRRGGWDPTRPLSSGTGVQAIGPSLHALGARPASSDSMGRMGSLEGGKWRQGSGRMLLQPLPLTAALRSSSLSQSNAPSSGHSLECANGAVGGRLLGDRSANTTQSDGEEDVAATIARLAETDVEVWEQGISCGSSARHQLGEAGMLRPRPRHEGQSAGGVVLPALARPLVQDSPPKVQHGSLVPAHASPPRVQHGSLVPICASPPKGQQAPSPGRAEPPRLMSSGLKDCEDEEQAAAGLQDLQRQVAEMKRWRVAKGKKQVK